MSTVPADVPAPFAALGLTFDDVLLLPGETDVIPSEVDTSSRLTREISVPCRCVSSAMDTVTESRMAIAMARQGGIGILHRNLSIEDQAQQVDLVKRSESGMISDPVTIGPDATLAELDVLCGTYRVSGLPVVDEQQVLLGIITNRDLRFVPGSEWRTRLVREVMTPMPLVTAPVGISTGDAAALLTKHKIEKLPLVDEAGRLTGLITVKDFVKTEQYPHATKDGDGRLVVGAAIGFFGDAWERATALVDAGVDVLVADTANGHARLMLDMVRRLKSDPATRHVQVIGGNVATRAGAQALVDAGADAVKVGVGPGLDLHHPRRRRRRRPAGHRDLRGGAGLPPGRGAGHRRRRPAVLRRHRQGAGGRRRHGDARLAAGRLRGEPGRAGLRQRQAVQVLPRHGLARRDGLARQDVVLQGPLLPGRRRQRRQDRPRGHRGPGALPRPAAARSSHQLIGGLQQSMFYVGARTIPELQERGRFVRITSAGLKESHPHDIQMTVEAPNYSGR